MARRVSSPTLVGRAAEFGRLDAALDQARAGSTVLLFLGGEAGVGKSRLVETFAEEARERDALVFTGRCLDLAEGATPYAPFVSALRPLADELTEDELAHVLGEPPPLDPGRTELSALLPELCGCPPVRRERARLYEMALGLFKRMAALRPAVLILEDLHWIDVASRDLLAVLGGNLRHAGLLLIGTYCSDDVRRGHPLHGTLLELERSGRAERVELANLTLDQVTTQVESILGTQPARRQIRTLYERSGGNPFFVEELVAAGPGTGARVDGGLPESLREVLLTRVERLGPNTRSVLRAVAITGRGADDGLIAAATGLEHADLDAALHEAVAHRLLVVTGDGYDVRHDLLREALDADLLPGERRRLHAAVAQVLAEKGPSGESARHWHAAGDAPRALSAFVAAAVAAQAGYASAVALAHYERALRLWEKVPDAARDRDLDHAALLQSAAEMAMAEGETDRAGELIETAIGVVDPASDPLRSAGLHTLRGRGHWLAGDTEAAIRCYDEAVALLPAEARTGERAQVLALQGHALMLQCRFAAAAALCQEAVEIAGEVGDRGIEGYARDTLGTCLVQRGDVAAGLEELTAALRIARERDDAWELGRTYVNYSESLLSAGLWARAAEVGMEGVHVCRQLGYGRTTCMCAAGNTLSALIRLGRWSDADRLVDDVMEIDTLPWQRWGVTLAMAELDLRRGRCDEARGHLAEIAETVARTKDIDLAGSLHAARARLALAEGEEDRAREHVRAGLSAIRDSELLRAGPELCALGLRLDPHDPEGLLAECCTLIARLAGRPEAEAYGLQAEAEATRAGTPDPAAWRTAVAAWERLGEPYRAVYGRYREAEAILAVRGPRDEAEKILRAARETAEQLGATLLGREIEDLIRRARLSPSGSGRLGLTAREGEILALLSRGRTNRQIAEALFISERTVGVHVSRILRKLGVANRVAAADVYRASEL